jgi:putative oxidoreductase
MRRLEPLVFALLRIIAGGMFLCHGAQKTFGWLGPAQKVGTQLWVGGIIELVGGTLLALGLFTCPAGIAASGMMAVAYFQFHWRLQMSHFAFLPLVNHGELAVLYCLVFLFIAAHGPGGASLDALLRRKG